MRTDPRSPETTPRPRRSSGPSFAAALAAAAARVAPRATADWAARRFLVPPSPRPRPAEQAVLREASEGRVRVDGLAIATYGWGEPGPTVLLVHGWGGHAGQLTALVAPLRAAGLRVVAFDAPAHGASEGRRTDVAQMARAVGVVAGASGPLSGAVAHSIGAAATAAACAQGLHVPRAAWLAPAPGPRRFADVFARSLGLDAGARAVLREHRGRDRREVRGPGDRGHRPRRRRGARGARRGRPSRAALGRRARALGAPLRARDRHARPRPSADPLGSERRGRRRGVRRGRRRDRRAPPRPGAP